MTCTLPSGLAIKTQTETDNKAVGVMVTNTATTDFHVMAASGGTTVSFGDYAGADDYADRGGSTILPSSTKGSFWFKVPVQGWNG